TTAGTARAELSVSSPPTSPGPTSPPALEAAATTPLPAPRSAVGYSSTLYGASTPSMLLLEISSAIVARVSTVALVAKSGWPSPSTSSAAQVVKANRVADLRVLQRLYSAAATSEPGSASNAEVANSRLAKAGS